MITPVSSQPDAMSTNSGPNNSEAVSGSMVELELQTEETALPPTDHGKQAYLVLAGCTLIQAPVWGEQ